MDERFEFGLDVLVRGRSGEQSDPSRPLVEIVVRDASNRGHVEHRQHGPQMLRNRPRSTTGSPHVRSCRSGWRPPSPTAGRSASAAAGSSRSRSRASGSSGDARGLADLLHRFDVRHDQRHAEDRDQDPAPDRFQGNQAERPGGIADSRVIRVPARMQGSKAPVRDPAPAARRTRP